MYIYGIRIWIEWIEYAGEDKRLVIRRELLDSEARMVHWRKK
jgi:hypothetical protein